MNPFISLNGNACVKNGIPTLNCVNVIFQDLILATLYFSGAILVIVIILSGIKYITSRGDAKAIEAAQKTIIYAIIGIVLIFFAFVIVQFVINIISPSASPCLTGMINNPNCK